jgi:excisionase family DNA binding protein
MDTTTPNTTKPLTISVTDAAKILGISRASAYNAVRTGEIPCIKVGKRVTVPRAWLARVLETSDF